MSLLERTLSEIAKPKWEGAPDFDNAWDSARIQAQNLNLSREAREWQCLMLPLLSEARVLTIEAAQAAVLPDAVCKNDDPNTLGMRLRDAFHKTHPPFYITYIGLIHGEIAEYPPTMIGALVLSADEEKAHKRDWTIIPLLGTRHRTPIFLGEFAAKIEACYIPMEEIFPDAGPGIAGDVTDAAARIVAILQWLESANVEIIDTPISRQVRRQTERKGAQIAKTVRVRLPKSWRNGQPPQRSGSIDFEHRFEVRGHYKFFPDTTRLGQADPTKLSWVPEREGYFRRIWCPPFVKGPADKPLVPKTRRLTGSLTS